jgi:hypothetical protein
MARPKRAAAAKNEKPPPAKQAKGGLAVGDNLPEFELETDEQQTVASQDLVSAAQPAALGGARQQQRGTK